MHTRQLSAALISCVILISAWPHPVEAQDRWRLSSDPVLILGTATGPPHSAFHRVGGAVRMPDGAVVVADLGTMELRVFSASGDFLRSFGGQGGGPEEFGGLLWVDRCGSDSVAAYDFVRARLTWWTPEGELLRSTTPAGPTRDFPPYTVRRTARS